MSTQAIDIRPAQQMVPGTEFTREELDLIKSTVAPKLTDAEFKLFLYMAKARGLNPIKKQIYAVKRWDSEQGREVMTIQTAIDGFRLIAERTGKYAPGREPTYVDREGGGLVSATAYVRKMTADGTWHEVAATAFWDEYKQTKKGGELTSFWRRMPHGQLAKCAEALAIRKAFPDDTAGIYTFDEMAQADNGQDERLPAPTITMPRRLSERAKPEPVVEVVEQEPELELEPVLDQPEAHDLENLLRQSLEERNPERPDPVISEKQRRMLHAAAKENGHDHEAIRRMLQRRGISSSKMITASQFDGVLRRLQSAEALEA